MVQINGQKCGLLLTQCQIYRATVVYQKICMPRCGRKPRRYNFSMWMDPSPELIASVAPPAFNLPRTDEWLSEPET
jgi:hypothetical protein